VANLSDDQPFLPPTPRQTAALLRRLEPVYATHPLRVSADQPFQVLIATILSARTQDPTTNAAMGRLWQRAGELSGKDGGVPGQARIPARRRIGPADLLLIDERELAVLLNPVGFYITKAGNVLRACRLLLDEFGGQVPQTREELLRLPGVGRKVANLVLNICFDTPAICVDTHVHRIANRLGWVETQSPEQTEAALEAIVPPDCWSILNRVLVNHGQQVCQPLSPRCSACLIHGDCRRVGVVKSR